MATIGDLTAATAGGSTDRFVTRQGSDTSDKSITAALFPVSTAQQTEIDTKEDTITAGTTAQYYRGDKSFQTLDKAAVDLADVDDTSDALKPASTAQALLNANIKTPQETAAGTDNNQTGTTYTLVLTDADNKTVWMSNASTNVLTIPLNASVAFPIGTKINIIMEGAGVTSITGATGVTLNGVSAGSGAINNQYQGAAISKRGTDTWIVLGDIGTVA